MSAATGELDLTVREAAGAYRPALLIFAALFLACAAGAWLVMRSAPTPEKWAMFAVVWVWLLGLTQFGSVFVAIMRICGAGWARSFYRLGELITLAYMPFAFIGLAIIYLGGQEALFYWATPAEGEHLSPWLTSKAFLIRHAIGFLLFYGVVLVSFANGLVPDVDPQEAQRARGLRGLIYRRAARKRAKADLDALQSKIYYWSPIVIIVAALCSTFVAWDFGMMLYPHWHSTVYTMYYMIGQLFAGTALLFLCGVLLRYCFPVARFFDTRHSFAVGVMLTAFMCLWLYLFWAQFFVTWFGNLPEETGPLWKQIFGYYEPVFWVQIVLIFAMPLAALIFAKTKRSPLVLGLVSFGIVSGIWLNRYLMIMPAISGSHWPFVSPFGYLANIALLAGFCASLLLLCRAFPMISEWELAQLGDQDLH